jgi:bacillithiol biosynthesis cysteine-adding enzyme BshC
MYDDKEMEQSRLRLSRLPQTTRLFADFLDDFQKVSLFYAHSPDENGLSASAREAQNGGPTAEMRRAVVDILREENRAFGADESVEQNLDRLAAGAVAVVTGQQVGLFGGPAYTFYKAITAIHWADWLTKQGIPAVPVFWLATEDHDFAEADHVEWLTHDGLTRLEVHPANVGVGEPVGGIPLDDQINGATESAASSLAGPHAEEVATALRESYRSGETMGSACGKVLARIFAGRGLILMDPRNAGLHKLAASLFVKAIEQASAWTDALLARGKALEKGGYHAQVRVAAQSTLLFRLVNGRREAVRRRGEEFVASGQTFSRDEALAALKNAPEKFSANALLRPVMQDTLLPTAAYIGGGAEIAYFAQAEVVYRAAGVRMPAVLPRAGFTLVDARTSRNLRKYGLQFTDMLRGRQRLRAKMEQEILPKILARRFSTGEKTLRRLLKNFRAPLRRLDPTLVGAFETAERKILYQYEKLRGKAGRAEGFRTGVLERDERRLLEVLYPARGLQERSLSMLPFLAAQPGNLLDDLLASLRSGNSDEHRLIFLR